MPRTSQIVAEQFYFTSGGPADKAGIERGDVIISFDGEKIREMKELPYVVASTPVGKVVKVEVIRGGKQKRFEVKVGKLKEEQAEEELAEEVSDLGMTVDEITPELARQFGLSEERGLVVVQVEKNSPAGEAGLRHGDIIVEMDQEPMKDLDEYSKKIRRYKEGDTILFLVKRRKATLYLTLKVWE